MTTMATGDDCKIVATGAGMTDDLITRFGNFVRVWTSSARAPGRTVNPLVMQWFPASFASLTLIVAPELDLKVKSIRSIPQIVVSKAVALSAWYGTRCIHVRSAFCWGAAALPKLIALKPGTQVLTVYAFTIVSLFTHDIDRGAGGGGGGGGSAKTCSSMAKLIIVSRRCSSASSVG